MAAKQSGAVDKAAEQPKAKAPELKSGEVYTVVGTGKNRHLAKGNEYSVSGADAALIIEAGGATLKDK